MPELEMLITAGRELLSLAVNMASGEPTWEPELKF